jgi:hypothetical protein
MFLFRWISNILSIIGIICAILLVYFGFFPLKVKEQQNIKLTDIFSNCKVNNILTNSESLTADKISELNSQIGAGVPLDLVNNYFLNSLKPIAKKAGMEPRLTITSCEVDDTNPITKVDDFFNAKVNFYNKGSVDQVISKINQLPFIKISSVDIKLPSLLAKTNFCNAPIHRSVFYFFAQPTEKNIVMLEVNLQSAASRNQFQKISDNLLTTGQYVKSKLYCE